MHFIDQPFLQIFPNGSHPTAHSHVTRASRCLCPLQRSLDSISHEMKLGSTFHRDRRPGVVGKHEHGDMVRRILSPPAFPVLIRPWPANRTEHIPAKNPRANILKSARREVIV